MASYVPPGPGEVYSQGFWHAVIAATLYIFTALILMINMLGYFLGHYPQHFELTDEQRNVILQTMMFFLWLAAGGGVFSAIEGWQFADALYFCDVTVLTIGFGDYYPTDNLGRGLVLPFSVGGIIVLGLMVSSIHKFARELSKDNVIGKHLENRRINTLSRVVTLPEDQRRDDLEKAMAARPELKNSISPPVINFDHNNLNVQFPAGEDQREEQKEPAPSQFLSAKFRKSPINMTMKMIAAPVRVLTRATSTRQKEIIMREEKDRFDAMRDLQTGAATFKKWYALLISVIAFGVLWCVGAVVFWQCEKHTQGMTYFQALYFCYVSLLTIGYGDLAPKSNAGKPFFIVWSLIAVPTMTILISDMGDTVISAFRRGTDKVADFTVLPKAGILKDFVDAHPWLKRWMLDRAARKRIKQGFQEPDFRIEGRFVPTIEELCEEDPCEQELTKRLAFAIRRTADDLERHVQRYSYEEWVEFTRLIRFTKPSVDSLEHDEDAEGVIEWDWLAENSPMLSKQTEPEWVLDRLCESLLRLLKKNRLSTAAGLEGESKDSDETMQGLGFSPVERKNSEDIAPDDPIPNPRTQQLRPPMSKLEERRRRAVGAEAILTFFTGERRGAEAYVNASPLWSSRALQKNEGKRRSSVGTGRKGPFKACQSRTGAMGGGRGGAGTRTLKARVMYRGT